MTNRGGGIYNNRAASADSTINSSTIANISQVCNTLYSPGVSAPPLIFEGTAFYTTWSGLLVAQQYLSPPCTTLWTANITQIALDFGGPLSATQIASGALLLSRSSPVTDGASAVFVGTHAWSVLLAFDLGSGALRAGLQLDRNELAVLTGSPTFYEGRVYYGVSSVEVTTPGVVEGYECCSLVGHMTAVSWDAETSQLTLLWSVDTITQPDEYTGAPFSGAMVWGSQPSIDAGQNQVLIGTGNLHSITNEAMACRNSTPNGTIVIDEFPINDPCLPDNVYQETLLALDLDTGHINWATHLGAIDDWTVACVVDTPLSLQCPPFPGLDGDFGMAPTFVPGSDNTPDRLSMVVAGQKNGYLYSLSALDGSVLWAVETGPSGLEGGLSWGVAVDETAVYYTQINTGSGAITLSNGTTVYNSVWAARSLRDGSLIWQVALPDGLLSEVPPTVVNDVVLQGVTGPPGRLIALSKTDGSTLKEIQLADYYKGGVAVVGQYAMLGTGYRSIFGTYNGSFQVLKV